MLSERLGLSQPQGLNLDSEKSIQIVHRLARDWPAQFWPVGHEGGLPGGGVSRKTRMGGRLS